MKRIVPMRNRIICFIQIAVCILVLQSCIGETPTGANLQVGDKIPHFEVTMNDGTLVTDSSLAGNPALIVFFHTGCPDCQKELPIVQQFYDYLQTEKSNINLLCISRAEKEASVASYFSEHSLSLPYSAQDDREVYALFATTRIPRIYVVNPEGVITAMWDDQQMPSVEQLQQAFK